MGGWQGRRKSTFWVKPCIKGAPYPIFTHAHFSGRKPSWPARRDAARLRPFYDAKAKERQGKRNDLNPDIQEKVPESANQQARDAAGKAANVNGRYVDDATIPRHPGTAL